MTLLKGEAALAARRHVASSLNHSAITALQRARRIDKPNWSLMQQLHDAGFKSDPISGMPVYDPSRCSPKLLSTLWRAYCGIADTINTYELGQTEDVLEELNSRLHDHAAKITETGQRAPRALAKRSRLSPTPSLSDEATDAGKQFQCRKKRVIDDKDDEE